MDTNEINAALHNTKDFLGTYALDRIPKVKRFPAGLVINTDSSDKPGEHWVAVYFTPDGSAEYFDSFGLPPLKRELLNLLNNRSFPFWRHNSICFQHWSSLTCGNYCILFLKHRSEGHSFCDFIRLFSNSKMLNDFLVLHYTE